MIEFDPEQEGGQSRSLSIEPDSRIYSRRTLMAQGTFSIRNVVEDEPHEEEQEYEGDYDDEDDVYRDDDDVDEDISEGAKLHERHMPADDVDQDVSPFHFSCY